MWRHCGSGPNHRFVSEAEDCARNPWVNLLYINNFDGIVENQGGCLGVTWYLANDMQFFLIAPPIIYMTWHWKKIGFALIGELPLKRSVGSWYSHFHYKSPTCFDFTKKQVGDFFQIL